MATAPEWPHWTRSAIRSYCTVAQLLYWSVQLFVMNSLDLTTLSTIMTNIFTEQDTEVLNYVYTLFEKFGNSNYGCMDKERLMLLILPCVYIQSIE